MHRRFDLLGGRESIVIDDLGVFDFTLAKVVIIVVDHVGVGSYLQA